MTSNYPKYPNTKKHSEYLSSRKAMPWQPASFSNIFFLSMVFLSMLCFLSLMQLLACVSMMLWKIFLKQGNMFGQILTFTLLYGSLYSTYMWTGSESSHTHTHIKQYFMDKVHFHWVILGCSTSPLCCAVVAMFSSCVDIVL